MFVIYLVVLVDLIGFGLILPAMPFFAEIFGVSAFGIGCLFSAFSLAQFFFAPLWGSLSDRIGRKKVMLIGVLGSMVSYLIFAGAASYSVLLFSRLFAGAMAGNIAAAQAYIADVSERSERSKWMAIFGACFGIGFTLGPALSAFLLGSAFQESSTGVWISGFVDDRQYAVIGLVAAALSAVSAAGLCFFVKEPQRVSTSDSEKNSAHLFIPRFWITLFKENLPVFIAVLSMLILSFSQSNLYASFPVFMGEAYKMNAADVGRYYMGMGLFGIIIQGFVLRSALKIIAEWKIFASGVILSILGFFVMFLSHHPGHIWISLILMTAGMGFCVPLIQSSVSRYSADNVQGKMMGVCQGMAGLGRILGPAGGGAIYLLSPRLPFLVVAGALCLLIIPAIYCFDKISGNANENNPQTL